MLLSQQSFLDPQIVFFDRSSEDEDDATSLCYQQEEALNHHDESCSDGQLSTSDTFTIITEDVVDVTKSNLIDFIAPPNSFKLSFETDTIRKSEGNKRNASIMAGSQQQFLQRSTNKVVLPPSSAPKSDNKEAAIISPLCIASNQYTSDKTFLKDTFLTENQSKKLRNNSGEALRGTPSNANQPIVSIKAESVSSYTTNDNIRSSQSVYPVGSSQYPLDTLQRSPDCSISETSVPIIEGKDPTPTTTTTTPTTTTPTDNESHRPKIISGGVATHSAPQRAGIQSAKVPEGNLRTECQETDSGLQTFTSSHKNSVIQGDEKDDSSLSELEPNCFRFANLTEGGGPPVYDSCVNYLFECWLITLSNDVLTQQLVSLRTDNRIYQSKLKLFQEKLPQLLERDASLIINDKEKALLAPLQSNEDGSIAVAVSASAGLPDTSKNVAIRSSKTVSTSTVLEGRASAILSSYDSKPIQSCLPTTLDGVSSPVKEDTLLLQNVSHQSPNNNLPLQKPTMSTAIIAPGGALYDNSHGSSSGAAGNTTSLTSSHASSVTSSVSSGMKAASNTSALITEKPLVLPQLSPEIMARQPYVMQANGSSYEAPTCYRTVDADAPAPNNVCNEWQMQNFVPSQKQSARPQHKAVSHGRFAPLQAAPRAGLLDNSFGYQSASSFANGSTANGQGKNGTVEQNDWFLHDKKYSNCRFDSDTSPNAGACEGFFWKGVQPEAVRDCQIQGVYHNQDQNNLQCSSAKFSWDMSLLPQPTGSDEIAWSASDHQATQMSTKYGGTDSRGDALFFHENSLAPTANQSQPYFMGSDFSMSSKYSPNSHDASDYNSSSSSIYTYDGFPQVRLGPSRFRRSKASIWRSSANKTNLYGSTTGSFSQVSSNAPSNYGDLSWTTPERPPLPNYSELPVAVTPSPGPQNRSSLRRTQRLDAKMSTSRNHQQVLVQAEVLGDKACERMSYDKASTSHWNSYYGHASMSQQEKTANCPLMNETPSIYGSAHVSTYATDNFHKDNGAPFSQNSHMSNSWAATSGVYQPLEDRRQATERVVSEEGMNSSEMYTPQQINLSLEQKQTNRTDNVESAFNSLSLIEKQQSKSLFYDLLNNEGCYPGLESCHVDETAGSVKLTNPLCETRFSDDTNSSKSHSSHDRSKWSQHTHREKNPATSSRRSSSNNENRPQLLKHDVQSSIEQTNHGSSCNIVSNTIDGYRWHGLQTDPEMYTNSSQRASCIVNLTSSSHGVTNANTLTSLSFNAKGNDSRAPSTYLQSPTLPSEFLNECDSKNSWTSHNNSMLNWNFDSSLQSDGWSNELSHPV